MRDDRLIVVGGGSVGCLLAMRMARDFGVPVTLIEPESAPAPLVDRQRPVRWMRLLGSTDDYAYATSKSAGLAGRAIAWPRGRGLGGSSRINAMIWLTPTQEDFHRLDSASQGTLSSARLSDALRKVESMVQPEAPRWLSPTAQAFLASHPGETYAKPYRRFTHSGVRWSSERLLHTCPDQIEIVRGTVERILWNDQTAVGVQAKVGNASVGIRSLRGVVLCAGAVVSPCLLQLSGIGQSDQLRSLQVPVVIDAPQVGQNLQDHIVMPVIFNVNSTLRFPDPCSMRELCRWQVTGTGPIACNIAECGGIRQDSMFQIHVTPTHYLKDSRELTNPALTIAVNATTPRSRGTIRCLRSEQLFAPEINPGYLQASEDLEQLLEGIQWVRELAQQSPLAQHIIGELVPGSHRQTPNELSKAITRYSQTLYHPCGTCALGTTACTVVTEQFAVRGAGRLWIADASILPTITQGNPSAMLLAVGWVAAEEIHLKLEASE